jgi:hypothetical protein
MMDRSEQHELFEAGKLLDARGDLIQVGWSRQPLLDCNLEDAYFYRFRPLQGLRIKRWDYYGVTTPSFYLSFTLAHLGYAGQVFAYLVDFAKREHIEQTVTIPFGKGIFLPRNSTEGEGYYENKQLKVKFQTGEKERRLHIDWPKFGGGGLKANLELFLPQNHESMVIVIPFTRNRFYYNRKVNCIALEGWFEYKGERHAISRGESLGNLDWGRGIWPYHSFWVWASASGFLSDGRTIGLNLGFGFGDPSRATENAIILDGRVNKLGAVQFDYSSSNFMLPWKMTTPDRRLDLTFEPFLERVAKTQLLLIASEVHQIFGRYSGSVVADDGEKIRLDGMIGFAEEHYARW